MRHLRGTIAGAGFAPIVNPARPPGMARAASGGDSPRRLAEARDNPYIPDRFKDERETSMECPIDGTQLVMADRAGVEIDYCPQCRGVWLDRGELDKIIERSAQSAPPPPQAHVYEARDDGYTDRDRDHDRDGRPRRKKRGGFLEDIFDF